MDRKKVLITVNPWLIKGRRLSTLRSMVSHLDARCDLFLIPCDAIDFRRRRCNAYKRIKGGSFKFVGEIRPEGDLWINYSDGYYLNTSALGFKRRIDFFYAQMELYQRSLENGWVHRVVNTPTAERNTLKDWFVTLDLGKHRVIPTRVFQNWDDVLEYRRSEIQIVSKLNWGGAGLGALLLQSDMDVLSLKKTPRNLRPELDDLVFQKYLQGEDKRLWFLGGYFVDGRKVRERGAPWESGKTRAQVRRYDHRSGVPFQRDLENALLICRLSQIEIGSVDLIGDHINEVNGCGTLFTAYQGWEKKVDARPQLLAFLDRLIADS